MCNAGLYGLLKRSNVSNLPSLKYWHQSAPDYWRKLFYIEKLEKRNRGLEFCGEIVTDGKSASVVLKKPKPISSGVDSNNKEGETFVHLWGLDPGRRNMFAAISNDHDKVHCSSREFYEDVKYKESNRTIRTWHGKDKNILEAIRNIPTKKTAYISKLKEHVSFLLPRLGHLLERYGRKRMLNPKFKRYVMAQKKLDKLCKKLTKSKTFDHTTVVGFGDWSATGCGWDGLKKCPGGPIRKFERRLKHCCKVIPVDEFKTSKLHSSCHFHSVLYCTNANNSCSALLWYDREPGRKCFT